MALNELPKMFLFEFALVGKLHPSWDLDLLPCRHTPREVLDIIDVVLFRSPDEPALNW